MRIEDLKRELENLKGQYGSELQSLTLSAFIAPMKRLLHRAQGLYTVIFNYFRVTVSPLESSICGHPRSERGSTLSKFSHTLE